MNSAHKQVWENLEKSIGRCFLYREGAVKEISGMPTFTLTFATLCIPEKVEEFLKNKKGVQNKNNTYAFVMDGIKVELTCFSGGDDLDPTYEKIFRRTLRCETIGINSKGQWNRKGDAYRDIKDKVLHFTDESPIINEAIVGRLLLYILNSGYTLGEDVLEMIQEKGLMKSGSYRIKFCEMIADSMRKDKCNWQSVAEALRLVSTVLPSDTHLPAFTANLTVPMTDKTFIRNYLYTLFIAIGMTSRELQSVMSQEPTLQYFDSLCKNIDAYLKDYKTYSEIKKNYGDEFLSFLMDIQECIAKSEDCPYERVTDATFDAGERFMSEQKYWCDPENIELFVTGRNDPEEGVRELPVEERIDLSKGDAGSWLDDKFDGEMYADSDAEPDETKVYVDDEPEVTESESGIDRDAFAAYESPPIEKPKPAKKQPPAKRANNSEDIMNRSRGHESKVLDNGGA